ncbi:MAG: META domain-containing protein [Minisyncoccia bacterium]
MKTNQIYVVAAIVFIVLGLLLWAGDNTEEVIDTSTTTPTNTVSTNKPSGTVNVSKPSPSTGNTIVPKPSNPTTQTPVPSIPSASSLNGLVFKMVSYNGSPVPVDARYTISFNGGNGGTLSAKFCNNMSGNFVLDGSLLKVSNFASTMMYCTAPANLAEIESAFTSMLNFGATIYRSDNNIIISSASKSTVMVFEGF